MSQPGFEPGTCSQPSACFTTQAIETGHITSQFTWQLLFSASASQHTIQAKLTVHSGFGNGRRCAFCVDWNRNYYPGQKSWNNCVTSHPCITYFCTVFVRISFGQGSRSVKCEDTNTFWKGKRKENEIHFPPLRRIFRWQDQFCFHVFSDRNQYTERKLCFAYRLEQVLRQFKLKAVRDVKSGFRQSACVGDQLVCLLLDALQVEGFVQ